jgi:hypothetical protein
LPSPLDAPVISATLPSRLIERPIVVPRLGWWVADGG